MTTRPAGSMPAFFSALSPDTYTAHFWDAAREHRLVCQRCRKCSTFQMPPAPICHKCQQQDAEYVELNGNATVYGYTVVHHAAIPALAEHVPYVIAVVELEGATGARLVTNVIGGDPEQVRIGMPVHVVWDDVSEDVTVPLFAP